MKTALVFDTSPLSHFARAGDLNLLDRITAGSRRVAVRAVLDEVRNGLADYPALKPILEVCCAIDFSGQEFDEAEAFADVRRQADGHRRSWSEAPMRSGIGSMKTSTRTNPSAPRRWRATAAHEGAPRLTPRVAGG